MNETIDSLSIRATEVPFIDLNGDDCRLMETSDDHVIMTFARRGRGHILQPQYAELYFWLSGEKLTLAVQDIVQTNLVVDSHPEEGARDQKNWVAVVTSGRSAW